MTLAKMLDSPKPELSFDASLRRDLRRAGIAILVFFVCGGIWATFTEISGAVIANGKFALEADLQRIQYLDGGIASEILVKNGDKVDKGQTLLRMEITTLNAQFEIAENKLIEALLLQERLLAELRREDSFTLPARLTQLVGPARAIPAYQSQVKLLKTRLGGLENKRAQLIKQKEQTQLAVAGYSSSAKAVGTELAIVAEELAGLKDLLANNLVEKRRVVASQRAVATLEGSIAAYETDRATSESRVAGLSLQLLQLDDAARGESLELLQTTRAQAEEYLERYDAAKATLARAEIRAPRAGIVHELSVNNAGQVVPPGGEVMLLVPSDDVLLIQARIQTSEVDQVFVGQNAKVKLTAFDARLLPDMDASVAYVSADSVTDQARDVAYYAIELSLAESEFQKLGDIDVVAGMPVQVFFHKQDRSVLGFLLQPFLDRMNVTFRE